VDTLASQPATLESDGNPHFEGSPDEREAAVPLSDLLDQRRPHRADAARNFDAILAAARAGFTDSGAEAALENIARRAGVAPATLYRSEGQPAVPYPSPPGTPRRSPQSTGAANSESVWIRRKQPLDIVLRDCAYQAFRPQDRFDLVRTR
jgi:hypothetical protein